MVSYQHKRLYHDTTTQRVVIELVDKALKRNSSFSESSREYVVGGNVLRKDSEHTSERCGEWSSRTRVRPLQR